MNRSAGIAIVGGGVIGASVAYHLAKAGVRDILIIDSAARPGQGSTGQATGGFRAQFATPINVRLSMFSRQKLLSFREETGVDPGYQQVGYLWLASDDAQLGNLRAASAVQHAEGLTESREVSAHEIAALNPGVSLDGIVGGFFCPTDGYTRPLEILRGYLEAAARLGVAVAWDSSCLGFRQASGRIKAIRTTAGEIRVETVVNAAGPWAARVAEMAGVDLPVTPLRRQAAITEMTSAIPDNMPMTIFADNGFHVRARDGRALLCWPTDELAGDSTTVDDSWLATVGEMMRARVPALSNVKLERELCYAGLYEMSPDKHAIVGFATGCENLFLVNGSSGHGVMHSPALGAITAAILSGNDPPVDPHELRPSRFGEGASVHSPELL